MSPNDLIGGDVLQQGVCGYKGQPVHCVLVQKDNKLYVVLFDSKYEPRRMFLVKEGAKPPLEEDETTLVWSSDSV